jgi:hypothetical protein
MTQDSEGDGEEMKTEVIIMDKDYERKMRTEEYEAVPRKVYIAREDLEVHGYTVGCPGCKSILRGTTRQGHNEACRRRVEKELEGTEKANKAKKRVGEYMDKKMKEAQKERERRKEDKKSRKEEEDADRKRGDEEMPTAPYGGSSSSGLQRKRRGEKIDEEYTAKLLRKMDRKEKRKRGEEQDEEEDDMVGEIVNGKGGKSVDTASDEIPTGTMSSSSSSCSSPLLRFSFLSIFLSSFAVYSSSIFSPLRFLCRPLLLLPPYGAVGISSSPLFLSASSSSFLLFLSSFLLSLSF